MGTQPKCLLIFATFLLVACGPASVWNSGLASSSQTALIPAQTAESRRYDISNDLLYISNYATSVVKTYRWPDLSHDQRISGFTEPLGLCADARGDVFVANTNANNILEYAHGGTKPIATLDDLPKYYPSSCAIDPSSGDLAVTNLGYGSYGSQTANVVIFKNAKGQPKPYTISTIYYYYACGYDNHGDLIVNGSLNSVVAFATLLRGKRRLQALTLDQSFKFPGGIQWDGKHWAIGDQGATIYQFDVKGLRGTKVGTTTLDLNDAVYEFAIQSGRVVAPEYATGQAQVFMYPGGGTALATIPNLHFPGGITISPGK